MKSKAVLLTVKVGINTLLAVRQLVRLLPPIMPSKMAEELILNATKETFSEGLYLDEVVGLKNLVLKCSWNIHRRKQLRTVPTVQGYRCILFFTRRLRIVPFVEDAYL